MDKSRSDGTRTYGGAIALEYRDWLSRSTHVARPRTRLLWIKRAVDVIGAAGLLVALSPLLLLVALLVKLNSRGPALFVQKRVGRACRVFRMYKFRTMVDGAEELEDRILEENPESTFLKTPGDGRVTFLGSYLRKYSLDELPQLVNVLRGEMSLIGPRPLLISDFRKFPKQHQMRRFAAVPGMTGLWQVSGRSETTDRERMDLDREYVDRWSLGLDLEILLRTIPAVLRARGAV
jgi:lipopolysaccharide/colanic/teichoic acid biosynthesis glycosyltransferase